MKIYIIHKNVEKSYRRKANKSQRFYADDEAFSFGDTRHPYFQSSVSLLLPPWFGGLAGWEVKELPAPGGRAPDASTQSFCRAAVAVLWSTNSPSASELAVKGKAQMDLWFPLPQRLRMPSCDTNPNAQDVEAAAQEGRHELGQNRDLWVVLGWRIMFLAPRVDQTPGRDS